MKSDEFYVYMLGDSFVNWSKLNNKAIKPTAYLGWVWEREYDC